jgi:hypothetical protein
MNATSDVFNAGIFTDLQGPLCSLMPFSYCKDSEDALDRPTAQVAALARSALERVLERSCLACDAAAAPRAVLEGRDCACGTRRCATSVLESACGAGQARGRLRCVLKDSRGARNAGCRAERCLEPPDCARQACGSLGRGLEHSSESVRTHCGLGGNSVELENLPEAHMVHVVWPDIENRPIDHDQHVAPLIAPGAVEYLPPAQETYGCLCAVLKGSAYT